MSPKQQPPKEVRVYHGTDAPNFFFSAVKDSMSYHPGAGPVEFLGPSFSTSKKVAASYGKYLVERKLTLKNPKRFLSLQALRRDIIRTFGLPKSGNDIGGHYRDIADSYRVKLQAEGYDAVIFPEGAKHSVKEEMATTIIPVSDSFPAAS
jgi:hypothetical protein